MASANACWERCLNDEILGLIWRGKVVRGFAPYKDEHFVCFLKIIRDPLWNLKYVQTIHVLHLCVSLLSLSPSLFSFCSPLFVIMGQPMTGCHVLV